MTVVPKSLKSHFSIHEKNADGADCYSSLSVHEVQLEHCAQSCIPHQRGKESKEGGAMRKLPAVVRRSKGRKKR
jgi:hypothetical protein